MNFWWVNHGQTHSQEIEGRYIWCPQVTASTPQKETYKNLTLVRPGDVIFSFAKTKIRQIGVATSSFEVAKRPEAAQYTATDWNEDGWLVKVLWEPVDPPFKPHEQWDALRTQMGYLNSPLGETGGKQSVYLAHIPFDLGLMIQALAGIADKGDHGSQRIEDEAAAAIVASKLPETMKQRLIDARIGQGLFRRRLCGIESACRLTRTSDPSLLIASHIKPWRSSDNRERLDGQNGLLLAPHVDRLFDRGWISFQDDGTLLVSSEKAREALATWGLDAIEKVEPFNDAQSVYLAYHRHVIFGQAAAELF